MRIRLLLLALGVLAMTIGLIRSETAGDLRTLTANLKGVALRVDCGESDSFEPAISALRDQFPDPSVVHIAKGCHDNAFWRSVAPEQLKLIGTALTPPKQT